MALIDSLRALFSRRETREVARAEDIPEPTERPPADQERFEEVKDDDAIARGTMPAAPTLGAGTADALRDEFESDQEPPRDPAP